MENKSKYEKRRKILEDNIIRLMMERNLSARALSQKIWMNDWYITRMLNEKTDPSLDALFNIAEALKVEPAELFTKNPAVKTTYRSTSDWLCIRELPVRKTAHGHPRKSERPVSLRSRWAELTYRSL